MKNYIVMAGIAAAVFVVGILFVRPAQEVVEKVTNVGAMSTAFVPGPYFGFGGVQYYGQRTDSLVSATTTPAALQSPAATSTLMHASCQLSVSTTTASVLTLAKATTAFATTTLLASASLAANAMGTLVASSTANSGATLNGTLTFAPNTYVVFGMAGGIGTFSPTGSCSAVWLVN